MASIIFINLYNMEMLDHANFIKSGSIFNLPPYAKRKIHLNSFWLCSPWKSNPGRLCSKQVLHDG